MTSLPTFDPGFCTARSRSIFGAERRVAALLEVEAALARAQASAGLVPADAAAAIGEACAREALDAAGILEQAWEAGSVAVPLLEALRARLPPSAARFLHLGATTQDLVDTATMLQAREGIDAVAQDLERVARRCRELAREHRATPAQGRTFLQPAVATTFGHRVAGWLVAASSARRQLAGTRAALPLQLGGPAGHLGRMGTEGPRIRAELAAALGLRAPILAWHTDRQPVRDVVAALSSASACAAKIALDLVLLVQAEVAEIRVRAGRSSSMAHKANPVDALRALAAHEAFQGVSSVVARGNPQALERGWGAWHAESLAVPLVFHTAAAAVAAAAVALEGLEVDASRMAANLRAGGAESLDAAIAEVDRVLGRDT
ncbi:MAG: hypothetical protein JOZ69_04000 [Myxococcales bacterium]|nr:hypothetical protein [Myxococcales bacterium]